MGEFRHQPRVQTAVGLRSAAKETPLAKELARETAVAPEMARSVGAGSAPTSAAGARTAFSPTITPGIADVCNGWVADCPLQSETDALDRPGTRDEPAPWTITHFADQTATGASVPHGAGVHVQFKSRTANTSADTAASIRDLALAGVSHAGTAFPHREKIQASFGTHDISGLRASVGGPAREANQLLGSDAFAVGDRAGFAAAPDLHTAAHEAAHNVQQRGGVSLAGGVGRAGDAYESHADQVADRVVRGESAQEMLDKVSAADHHAGAAPPVQLSTAVQFTSKDDKRAEESGSALGGGVQNAPNAVGCQAAILKDQQKVARLLKADPNALKGSNFPKQAVEQMLFKNKQLTPDDLKTPKPGGVSKALNVAGGGIQAFTGARDLYAELKKDPDERKTSNVLGALGGGMGGVGTMMQASKALGPVAGPMQMVGGGLQAAGGVAAINDALNAPVKQQTAAHQGDDALVDGVDDLIGGTANTISGFGLTAGIPQLTALATSFNTGYGLARGGDEVSEQMGMYGRDEQGQGIGITDHIANQANTIDDFVTEETNSEFLGDLAGGAAVVGQSIYNAPAAAGLGLLGLGTGLGESVGDHVREGGSARDHLSGLIAKQQQPVLTNPLDMTQEQMYESRYGPDWREKINEEYYEQLKQQTATNKKEPEGGKKATTNPNMANQQKMAYGGMGLGLSYKN